MLSHEDISDAEGELDGEGDVEDKMQDIEPEVDLEPCVPQTQPLPWPGPLPTLPPPGEGPNPLAAIGCATIANGEAAAPDGADEDDDDDDGEALHPPPRCVGQAAKVPQARLPHPQSPFDRSITVYPAGAGSMPACIRHPLS